MTPDEKLMIKLYEVATQNGDPNGPIDYRGVARMIGQKETAAKNIIKHLAQANLVKKVDDSMIHLTERGCDFALEMIE